MTKLRKIVLHGALKKFSEEPLELAVQDSQEVFSALKSCFPKFKEFMWEHPNFHLVLSDKNISNPRPIHPEFFNSPFIGCEEIHVIPSTEGGYAVLAEYLVELGMSYATAVTVATIVINVAVSIVISAVSNMLAPQTKTDGTSEGADQRPSFLYNGPQNVTEQGYQVPIVYGTHMTGSVVVSAGVTVEQIPIPSAQVAPPSGTPQTSPDPVAWQWESGGD